MAVTSTIKYPEGCSAVVNFGKITEVDASGAIVKNYGDFIIKLVPKMEEQRIIAIITVVTDSELETISETINMAP